MFRASSAHPQEALHSSFWCELRAVAAVGLLQVVGRLVYWAWGCGCKSGGLVGCGMTCWSTPNLQPANSYNCTQLTLKTASVVPPEDESLTPETCRGLRHNKVIVKVKVY
jgi:hypothetical protein